MFYDLVFVRTGLGLAACCGTGAPGLAVVSEPEGTSPYSIELTCVTGIVRVMPSSPATVILVGEFSNTVPPTLEPSRILSVTCGALAVET
jgi:hypothetical protein